ncbi:MAG: hypothetical protein V7641_851 [Blastocatellia bacterium]
MSVDGGATASYSYDHQNRRYKTTVGSTVTHYLWKGGQGLAEHNGSTGAVLVNYVYAGNWKIARIVGGTTTYLLNDQLSVRLTLNTSGTAVGQQAHLPFGEDFAESGTQQKQHFTSYERDSQSGTDYAANRNYSSGTGRFQSADPFKASAGAESPQSWNRYAYVLNAPLDFIDPAGLNREEGPLPDPCHGNDAPPVEPLYVNYTDLSWRVNAFFAEKPNCIVCVRLEPGWPQLASRNPFYPCLKPYSFTSKIEWKPRQSLKQGRNHSGLPKTSAPRGPRFCRRASHQECR